MKDFEVVVACKRMEALDTCVFELAHVDGRMLPAFTAGSHVDVHVPGGPVRQYSLCNDPAETHRYVLGVLRDRASRGGSVGMHDRVSEGDRLWISQPRNHFALTPEPGPSLLLAGGIGVTPLLAMAEQLHRAGSDFVLHYCNRTRDRMAFGDRLRSSGYADRVRLHIDDESVVSFDFDAALACARQDAHLYVCGPAGFIAAAVAAADRAGWTDARVHTEFFAPLPALPGDDAPFDVKLARSGRIVHVPPGQSIVSVLFEHGIEVPISCEQGICGTCVTRVLGGIPDHRDQCLTNREREANDRLTACCSRSKSEVLTLDL